MAGYRWEAKSSNETEKCKRYSIQCLVDIVYIWGMLVSAPTKNVSKQQKANNLK